MALDEKQREKLRDLLVESLLSFRRQYLQTSGCNQLENWRIVLDRMQAASRSSSNVDEWMTQVAKWLQIQQLGKDASSDLLSLSQFVHERDAWPEARRIIDRERGLLECLGRSLNDQRVEARQAAKMAEGVAQ